MELKQIIVSFLEEKGIAVIDMGTGTPENFPCTAGGYRNARQIAGIKADGCILICRAGAGASLTKDKMKGIRTHVCSEQFTVRLSKRHGNTNVLTFITQVAGSRSAKMNIEEWLNTEFTDICHKTRAYDY